MSSSLRLKPWFHWTDEERSYAIYNAYNKRVLKSEDLKSFLIANRVNNVSTWGFPLIGIPLLSFTLFKTSFAQKILLTRPLPVWNGFRAASIIAAWVGWINFNPAYKHLENQKEKLLDTLESRIGVKVLSMNDALPRWTTAQEYNRKTLNLYYQRNGPLVGILYPQEESARPLVDISTFPKNFIKDKITK